MNSPFWQQWKATTRDATKWANWRRAKGVQKRNTQLVIPPFGPFDTSYWFGVSYIITEFRGNFTYPFSILPTFIPPLDVNYCLCVRRVHDYESPLNYVVDRYKLWGNGSEVLDSVDYNGELLCGAVAFEVWTTENSASVSQETELVFEDSHLALQTDCDDQTQPREYVYQVCQLFAELPLVLYP